MPTAPDIDLARVRRYCDAKVPASLRGEMGVEADLRGTAVTILDCRAPWSPDIADWSRVPVAQLRYDPSAQVWALYSADRNSRWHRYDEVPPGTVDDLLAEIDADPHGIFWG